MPLTLPDLDDRTYANLIEEARALIPALAPDWTDHNPADPGITLVELFAWLTDMLLYRVNEVPDENRLAFVQLIRGPSWRRDASKSVAEEVRDTVLALRQPGRAVTADDFERMALAVPGVARAHCLPRRNLELGDRTDPAPDTSADVSVIIVPQLDGADAALILAAVRNALEPVLLLTTRLHVVAPRQVTVAVNLMICGRGGAVATRPPVLANRPGAITVSLTVHGRGDAVEADLLQRAERALEAFFDPRTGGPDGQGWPLGRSVYLSEIYDLLVRQLGVDYVDNQPEFSADPVESKRIRNQPKFPADPVEAGPLPNQVAGRFAAIALEPDELVRLELAAGEISVKVP